MRKYLAPIVLTLLVLLVGCNATPTAQLSAAEKSKNLANNAVKQVIQTGLYDPTPEEAQAIYNVHAAADLSLDRARELIGPDGAAEPGFVEALDVAAAFTSTLARLQETFEK